MLLLDVEMLLLDRSVRTAHRIHDDGLAVGWAFEEFRYAATYLLFVPGAVQIPIGRIYVTATALF
jgi:hypothetical protein